MVDSKDQAFLPEYLTSFKMLQAITCGRLVPHNVLQDGFIIDLTAFVVFV